MLEQTLRELLSIPDKRSTTFGDILGATGIDLFVVAMDLSSRQPIVFSGSLSPTAQVATSIAASAAIPVAFPVGFPPVRVVSSTDVHRLIDGGTYANYPSFVFDDHEFRDYHGLPATTLPILGFTLEDSRPERPLTTRPLVPLRRATVDVVFTSRSVEGLPVPLGPYTNDALFECPLVRPTENQTCYRFTSSTDELLPGEGVTVAVDPERDVSHVIADQWLTTFGTNRTLLVLIGVGGPTRSAGS